MTAAPARSMSPSPLPSPLAPHDGPARSRRIRSDELFGSEAAEIEIEHRQQVYRLRRTALGKLILTK
jgi:hemin uptake protein HemP